MPRPFAESDEYLAIDTGPAIYEVSDSPSVRVKLKGLDGNPNSEAIVEAVVQREGKTVSTINLVADPELPGVYRSVLGNLLPGDYEVSIQASGYQQSALKSRGRFLVLAPELGESSETSVNQPLLQQMSNEAEGQLIPEEELYRLPELLEPLSNGRILESETVLWQSYWWFGSMMVLLTIEWILRKRSGLL